MPKKKRKTEEEIPEEHEEMMGEMMGEEEVPRVGLRSTPRPAEDKEAQWARIETEVATLKDDFITGRITLDETIDRLVDSLNAMKVATAPGLAGLGVRPEMEFPPAVPPKEEISPMPAV